MKKVIYISILALSFFVLFFLLVVYYTQDFSSELVFKRSLNYEDILVNSSDYYSQNKNYLTSAVAEIGTLTLENNGVFLQVYEFPNYVGCVNFKPGKEVYSLNTFSIYYNWDGTTFEKDYFGFSSKKIEIPVGSKKEIVLLGTIKNSYIDLNSFSKEDILGISIYEVYDSTDNPFFANYQYLYRDVCSDLKMENEPLKVIPFV